MFHAGHKATHPASVASQKASFLASVPNKKLGQRLEDMAEAGWLLAPLLAHLHKPPGEITQVRCGHVDSATPSCQPIKTMAAELNRHSSVQYLIMAAFCL